MSDIALKTLEQKFHQLLEEKSQVIAKYDAEIAEINMAMNALCGKMLKESEVGDKYNDDHADYISGTEDGI